jgi:hypothetical protein
MREGIQSLGQREGLLGRDRLRRIDGWQELKRVTVLKAARRGYLGLGEFEIVRYTAIVEEIFQAWIPRIQIST